MLSRDKFTTVSVPSDGSCLYWATTLAYLYPARHKASLFADHFVRAFGHDPILDSPRLRDLLLSWTPHGDSPTAFGNIITLMQPLINGHFRQRVIQEMTLRRDKYQHFISLGSFRESQNEGFFTRGLFQKRFQSEFEHEIEQCGVDISKLKPTHLGVHQMEEIDVELDKMASQQQVLLFKYNMYLKCMALSTSWGGQPEIQAASQLLTCNIHVFQDATKMTGTTFTGGQGQHWLYLAHSNGNHYSFALVKAAALLENDKAGLRVEEVERCFSAGVDDVNASNRFGWTMLHYAALRGDEGLARLLLDHGARVGVQNNHSKTPADLALKYRRFDVLKMLEKELLRIQQEDELLTSIQQPRNRKCNDGSSQDGQVKSTLATQTTALLNTKTKMASKATQTTALLNTLDQRHRDLKTASKATQTTALLNTLDQRHRDLKMAAKATQTTDEKQQKATATIRGPVASRGTQTTGGEQADQAMTSLRQVKVLQQQLLEVIQERNALEQSLMTSQRLEQDSRKEMIVEAGSLKKEIVYLQEEYASLKRAMEQLELKLRSTKTSDSTNSAVIKRATDDSGDDLTSQSQRTVASPQVGYKKHHSRSIPGDEQVKCLRVGHPGQQFSMASNVKAAGRSTNVVVRCSLLKQDVWTTNVLQIVLNEDTMTRLVNLFNAIQKPALSTLKYFEAYYFVNQKKINDEDLKLYGQSKLFDFDTSTNASLEIEIRIRQRDNIPRVMLRTTDALSLDELLDNVVCKSFSRPNVCL